MFTGGDVDGHLSSRGARRGSVGKVLGVQICSAKVCSANFASLRL